jgi:hypothetical protein
MGDLHVASERDLSASPERRLQRSASDTANPLLGLQSQAGNAAVSRLVRESGAMQVQRSCGCSGEGCSCGGKDEQEAEGAGLQGGESEGVEGSRP